VGKPPCGAEPRIELGPALQQADVLPTEQRRTTLTLPHLTTVPIHPLFSIFHPLYLRVTTNYLMDHLAKDGLRVGNAVSKRTLQLFRLGLAISPLTLVALRCVSECLTVYLRSFEN
jgi:hypothetical protein